MRSTFAVVGDLMGPSVNGLDRLVQVPYGCGEQNMITMAPNVAVISYLNAARRLTSELKQRAEDNIAMGYQRELQYRHSTERSRRLEKVPARTVRSGSPRSWFVCFHKLLRWETSQRTHLFSPPRLSLSRRSKTAMVHSRIRARRCTRRCLAGQARALVSPLTACWRWSKLVDQPGTSIRPSLSWRGPSIPVSVVRHTSALSPRTP